MVAIAFRAIAALSSGLVFAFGSHVASAQENDFYAGKTVRITVGTAPGAAYDFMARVVAAHYGRHIPGNPSFVVENVPGAASLVMLSNFTQRAPTDGTAIALPLGGIVHEPRRQGLSRDGSNVHFDARQLNWIGSPAQQPFNFTIWGDTPFKSFRDLQTQEVTFGTTSRGGDNYTTPTLTNKLLGTRIRIVAGYKGVNDIFRAMEQGEVHGTGMILAGLLAKGDWMRKRKVRVPVHFGIEPITRMPDVPAAIDLASDDEARDLFRRYAYKYQTTYPFLAPPKVPEDRLGL